MLRRTGFTIVLAWLLAACASVGETTPDPAGPDDTGGPSIDGGQGGDGDGDSNGDRDTGSGQSDGNAAGGRYAIVTIGERRYEVDLEAGDNGCADTVLGMGIGGAGYTDDANPSGSAADNRTTGAYVEVFIERSALEGGGERPYVRVDDFAEDTQWRSGLDPGETAVVTDWVYNGDVISGTAGFLEGISGASANGAFELYCGPRPEG